MAFEQRLRDARGEALPVVKSIALRLVGSDRYGHLPRWLQRWAFRHTSVSERTRMRMRKHADIIERLGRDGP